jgi:hypothetical protein
MNYTDFEFADQEVVVKLIIDPLNTSDKLDDVLEATVVNKGKLALIYEIGDKVLVRRDHARKQETPHFPKDVRVVPTEKYILCKFPK